MRRPGARRLLRRQDGTARRPVGNGWDEGLPHHHGPAERDLDVQLQPAHTKRVSVRLRVVLLIAVFAATAFGTATPVAAKGGKTKCVLDENNNVVCTTDGNDS